MFSTTIQCNASMNSKTLICTQQTDLERFYLSQPIRGLKTRAFLLVKAESIKRLGHVWVTSHTGHGCMPGVHIYNTIE